MRVHLDRPGTQSIWKDGKTVEKSWGKFTNNEEEVGKHHVCPVYLERSIIGIEWSHIMNEGAVSPT